MISTKHLVLVALCALPLTASAAPDSAGPKPAAPKRKGGKPRGLDRKAEAKKHIAAATKAHQAEMYDVALIELQAAYGLDPQPDLMYAIGQVQVKLNNCPEAIMSYEKFLESNPPQEPTDAANEAIKTCRDQIAAAQPPPPPPEPAPPPPPPPEHKKFYKDPIGDGLVVVGVGASVTGLVLYMGARSRLDDADGATTYAAAATIVEDAHSKRNIAAIVGGVGAVALSVGVWRWTRVGKSTESRVALVPHADGGAVVTWGGRF